MRKREERGGRLFWCARLTHQGAWVAALAATALTSACFEQGSEPTGEQVYYFSSLERGRWRPYTMVDQPPATLSSEERAQLEPIFEGFEANAERLFAQPDIEQRLEAIENAYIRASRYLDILPYYRADIERQGLQESPAAPRFLWALIRLGQEEQARGFARELVRARPDDADVWFLYGAYWIKFAATDEDAAARVVFAWSKAVELAPSYRGFEGVDALTMRRELSRLKMEHTLSPAKLDQLGAELEERSGARAARVASKRLSGARGSALQAAIAAATPVEERAEPVVGGQQQEVEERPEVVAPVEEEAPAAPVAAQTPRQELLMGMAQAKLELAGGEEERARVTLRRVIAQTLPDGKLEEAVKVLERDTDRFSLVRICWDLGVDEGGAARLFRAFAREDLEGVSSMTLYKRARFAADELNDYALAAELVAKLKVKDGAFARRYDVDALLK